MIEVYVICSSAVFKEIYIFGKCTLPSSGDKGTLFRYIKPISIPEQQQ